MSRATSRLTSRPFGEEGATGYGERVKFTLSGEMARNGRLGRRLGRNGAKCRDWVLDSGDPTHILQKKNIELRVCYLGIELKLGVCYLGVDFFDRLDSW